MPQLIIPVVMSVLLLCALYYGCKHSGLGTVSDSQQARMGRFPPLACCTLFHLTPCLPAGR